MKKKKKLFKIYPHFSSLLRIYIYIYIRSNKKNFFFLPHSPLMACLVPNTGVCCWWMYNNIYLSSSVYICVLLIQVFGR